MTIFEIGALLLGLSAAFGFINHRWLQLPHTIGLVIIAMLASGVIILADVFLPQFGITASVTKTLTRIDFDKTLLNGMLSFLLFAGAVHVDLDELAQRKWAIGLMATLGVIASTFMIAGAMWLIMGWAGQPINFLWALVFGALITPTDPVAVMGLLKTVRIPPLLKAKIAGESLFNDGVGVVVFTIMLTFALADTATTHGTHGTMDVWAIIKLFSFEAGGGILLGAVG
ncbi:MAG TPA: sodium:proton antiporter, partial [Rhizobiales bacterium]|nr:sodium:proton antiporter [Hyphomicrobiales bacterium]